jgi:hypothetical protein
MFIGNTLVRVDEVRSKYSGIEYYDLSDEENSDLKCDVVLKEDFDNRIGEIYSEVNSIIKTLEHYDLASGIDELKILAEKLY